MIALINSKLKRIESNSELKLTAFEFDMINQIISFVKLDMSKYGVKNNIKLPQ